MPKHAAIRAPKPLSAAHDRHRAINVQRTPSPSWVSGWRDKIQVTRLINRLQTFALDDPDQPTAMRMTRTQAMVALSLLRKVMPDMQSVELSGNADQPITVQVLRFADLDANTGPHANGTQNGTALTLNAPGEPLTIDLIAEDDPRLIEDEPQKPSKSASSRRSRSR